jgi:hypothetical protein
VEEMPITGSIHYTPDTTTGGDVLATLTLSMTGNIDTGIYEGRTKTSPTTREKIYSTNQTGDSVVFSNLYGFT